MKEKGQVITTDFMLSLVIVILAFGIIVQFMEVKSYDAKDEAIFNDLKRVGETAASRLVASPSITCELVGGAGQPLDYLNNCLSWVNLLSVPAAAWPPSNDPPFWNAAGRSANAKLITKEKLGIPSDYSCLIDVRDSARITPTEDCLVSPTGAGDVYCLPILDCTDDPPRNAGVYSTSRKIVLHSMEDDSTVKKVDFYDCANPDNNPNPCNLEEATILIWVWKT